MDRKSEQVALRGTWRSTENARLLKEFLRSREREDVLQRLPPLEKYFDFFVSFYPTMNYSTMNEGVTIFIDTMDQRSFFHQFGLNNSRYIVHNNGPHFSDEVCGKISLLLEDVLYIVGKTELEIKMTLRLMGDA